MAAGEFGGIFGGIESIPPKNEAIPHALTDTAIRAAKPTDKPRKLSDSDGLFLLINPAGSRLWRYKYRVEGREKLLALGAYPDIGLAKARERRDEARRILANGDDPSALKKQARKAAQAAILNTFRTIAGEYLAKRTREGLTKVTLDKKQWLLDFALPKLGDMDVAAITAADVLGVLRTIEATGKHETARRVRSAIGGVFRYAIATARAENDPTFALRDALTSPKVEHRAAITTPKAFGGLLRAIEGYEGQPTTKAALKLMATLFQRPGGVARGTMGRVRSRQGNLVHTGRAHEDAPAHRVPLPRQAVAILRELQALTGNGELVFPCIGKGRKPISENTMNGALRRLGFGPDVATSHGFRATASTLLNESGKWNPDAVERQLAHAENNEVRRAYARGEHWEERVSMLQWWADELDRLKAGGKVLRLVNE